MNAAIRQPTRETTREQPMRGHTLKGQPLRRRRRSEREQSPFYVDKATIPPGVTYDFKRWTVWNLPDPEHQRDLQRDGGWMAVPSSRHPELALPDAKPEDPIIIRGCMLMERPEEFTKEAQLEDLQAAVSQVADKKKALGLSGNELGPARTFAMNTAFVNDRPAEAAQVPAA